MFWTGFKVRNDHGFLDRVSGEKSSGFLNFFIFHPLESGQCWERALGQNSSGFANAFKDTAIMVLANSGQGFRREIMSVSTLMKIHSHGPRQN
jgi:hypothetical protein